MDIEWLESCPKRNKLAYWKVNHCLWGQELNISDLEFREETSGLCMICHFSFRHSLQTLLMGLKILPLSIFFQWRVYGIAGLFSFKLQRYPESLLLYLFSKFLSAALCPYSLFLKFLAIPAYVSMESSSVLVTVQQYTTQSPSATHRPARGQDWGPARQLQGFGGA